MKVNEITNLFNRIKKHYNVFTYDETKTEEWYKFLKNYTNESVSENFEKYILEGLERPPLVAELIRGAEKINEETKPPVYVQCDLCGKKLLIGEDDWDIFEKHHRKCSKIDFIDRQTQKTLGEVINKDEYYAMSDDELESIYRKVMDTYMRMKNSTSFLKRIPDED